MATEYEWKFKATPEKQAVLDRAFALEATVFQMETSYYDTADGALSALRYTLRRRLENGVSVCTLKTPVGIARGEWETECENIEAAIPKLVALGAPATLLDLTKDGLAQICGARFTRIAKTVETPACTVELALDSGVLLGGGREEPLCEVEVELKAGGVADCDAFAKDLASRFGLEPEEKSKFSRALALYKGE